MIGPIINPHFGVGKGGDLATPIADDRDGRIAESIRVPVLEERPSSANIAKRNYAIALEMTLTALAHEDTAEIRRRTSKAKPGRLAVWPVFAGPTVANCRPGTTGFQERLGDNLHRS